MTRQVAEKMIENHLLAIREIIMGFGSEPRKIFCMDATDTSISGWMFENGKDSENREYALKVEKYFEGGDK